MDADNNLASATIRDLGTGDHTGDTGPFTSIGDPGESISQGMDSIERPFTFPADTPLGAYTFRTEVVDATSRSAIVWGTVIVTNIRPTVSFTVSDTEITEGESITLTAVVDDSDGVVKRVSFIRGKVFQSFDDPASSTITRTYEPVGPGQRTFYAQVFDNDGGVTNSDDVTFNVIAPPPNVPPMVSISASDTAINEGESVTVTAAAFDSDGSIQSVEFRRNGTAEETDTSFPFDHIYSSASAGTHIFEATAIDDDAAATISNTETVEVNAKPTVSLTVSPTEITLGEMVTLTATAADSDGTVTRVSFIRGKVFQSFDDPAPTVTHTYPPAETGEYTFYAQAFDNDGAVTSSDNVTFTVMAADPVDGVSLSSSESIIALGSEVTLTAEVSKEGGSVERVKFYRDGSLVNTDTASPYSYADTPSAVGTYSYYARAEFSDQTHLDSMTIDVEVVEFLKWEDIDNNGLFDQVLATLIKPMLGGFVTDNKVGLTVTDNFTSLDFFPPNFLTTYIPTYEVDAFLLASVRFEYQEGSTYRVQFLGPDGSFINWSPVLSSESDQAIRDYILWCNFERLWVTWAEVPAAFRVVQIVEASKVIGEVYSEDVNGDGVNETVQNVTAAQQPIGSGTGDFFRITLSLPNSVSDHHYQIQICIGGGEWTDFNDIDPIIGDGNPISISTNILDDTLQLAKFRFVDFGEVTDSQLVVDFKNHQMTNWKIVRPSTPPDARIGVIKADTIEFRLREKSGLDLATTEATWSGEKAGTGDTISVTFNQLGNKTQSVQYNNSTSINTTITVKEATGPGN